MKQLFFNTLLAFRSIANNKLRSIITITIIAIGIMALVAILTAIDAMKAGVYSNFSWMGANTLQISSDVVRKKRHGDDEKSKNAEEKNITFLEARTFKDRFFFPANTTISFTCSRTSTAHFGSEKTNPNVRVIAVDENYLPVTETKLDYGRNFSLAEIQTVSYECILGSGIAKKLFKNNIKNAVNKIVSIGNLKCRVIGIMEAKGGSMIMDANNNVIIPINLGRLMTGGDLDCKITIAVQDVKMKDVAAEEAEGIFRATRKIQLGTQNNFTISQNNELISTLINIIMYIRIAAIVIAVITLLGSVVGLMNIMLVSVSERTREIGVCKALGARSSVIKSQFLTESVLISVLGGITGVFLGMILGNFVSLIFGIPFIVPWLWILMGVSICAFVGVISGIYPAIKASKLNPIEALRYE